MSGRKNIPSDLPSAYRHFGLKGFQSVLPDEAIERISNRHGADLRRRSLTLKSHFWILAYGLCDPTIRGMATLLNSAAVRLGEQIAGELQGNALHKSSLSKKNSCLKRLRCFRDLFRYLVKEASRYRQVKRDLERFSKVSLIDASLLDLGISLLKQFGTSRTDAPTKAQVKINASFEYGGQIPNAFSFSRGNKADIKNVSRLTQKAHKALFIWDLGYWDYNIFDKVNKSGNFYISRLKGDAVYRAIRTNGPEDLNVEMGSPPTKTKLRTRMVGVPFEGETYWYITNLPRSQFMPERIAELYRRRWEIERFFFNLKEILRVRRLHSRTPNGVKLEIYAALCTYLIVKILMHQATSLVGMKVSDLSFRKSYHFVSMWVRQYVASPSQITLKQVDDLLINLHIYAPAEPKKRRRRVTPAMKRASA